MATRKSGRAGGIPPVRPNTEASLAENTRRGETNVMPSYGTRTQTQTEGVTVIGEAVRRTLSESAEVIIEVTSAAPTAAQALRDNHSRSEERRVGKECRS